MIDISLTKLLLLAVVALIVLGPERLPHAARTAGALLRRMRSGWESVRAEVEREIQAEEIKRTLRETAENARATHDSVREEVRGAGASFREAGESVRDTFTETQAARAEAREPDPAREMLPLKNDTHDRT
jgi:sec-independent protein translocase protein TatB